jgi:hypothetical protein
MIMTVLAQLFAHEKAKCNSGEAEIILEVCAGGL